MKEWERVKFLVDGLRRELGGKMPLLRGGKKKRPAGGQVSEKV
jgi:hypothetical protein